MGVDRPDRTSVTSAWHLITQDLCKGIDVNVMPQVGVSSIKIKNHRGELCIANFMGEYDGIHYSTYTFIHQLYQYDKMFIYIYIYIIFI